ncbi:hypothetical protein ACLKA7_005487 [Drosophila subpalustris]
MQAFRVVENEKFVKLINVLDPRFKIPCRKTLQKVMCDTSFTNLKVKLMEILEGVEYCAIITDIWTACASQGYLTVTCHFLTKDFKLRSAVLSTNTLQDETNHKAANIGATLKSILEHWKIWKKVSAIVTDNEAQNV